LHGLPGLFGGLTAFFVVKGLSGSDQLKGIIVTVVISLVAGYAVGKIVSSLGRRVVPYVDSEEFAEVE
jgi:ammonium transporter Rh